MNFRTDLAVEIRESFGESPISGIVDTKETYGNVTVSKIRITDEKGAASMGKPIGTYVTIDVPSFTKDSDLFDGRIDIVAREISALIPKDGPVLVIGLGNSEITPDALGPKTASYIFATRHIQGEIAKSIGFNKLRAASVLAPGVLGQTGIETGEIVKSIADSIAPSCAIIIDALASRSLNRLGRTVQISDTGINPGSGVGNHRAAINSETVGIPVISIGVPTIVDAATLSADIAAAAGMDDPERLYSRAAPIGSAMMVTPREIDLFIVRAARLVAMGINCALNPHIDTADMYALVS